MRKVILHLTDLHFGWDGNDVNKLVERQLCLNSLITAISKLDEDWRPNIICISGDIGWGGIEKDYIEAKRWLDKLLMAASLDFGSVLMCAGNHDVERNKAVLLNRPEKFADAQDLLKIPVSIEMKNVFQEFADFCQTSGILPYKIGSEDSYLWGERIVDGIRFVTLNTSWFCKDAKDKENLWIGQKLLNFLEANEQFPAINETAEPIPTVVMMHHPFEWLNPEESHGFGNKINTKDYIAHRGHILITGHEHGESRRLDMIAESMYHSKGGATYSGGHYDNNARLFAFVGNSLLYKSLIYNPGSPTRQWDVSDSQSVSINRHTAQFNVFRTSGSSQSESGELPKNLTIIPADYGGFLGRDLDLLNLKGLLNESSKVVLVNGLGGIGKTTLAKRFVKTNAENFDHLIWIAISREQSRIYESGNKDLIQSFLDNRVLFDNLKLPYVLDGENDIARFSRLMNAIRNLNGNNLLVIDNAGRDVEQRIIKDALPVSSNWKVLLTSRYRSDGFTIFAVDRIDLDASLDLFYLHYKYPCDRSKVIEILNEIDCHTLTVELFAKTLQSHYGSISVEHLLDRLHERRLDDPNFQRTVVTEHNQETEIFQNLMTVFSISDLSNSEKQLLKQLALLPPDFYDINHQLAVALNCTFGEDLKSLHNTIGSLEKKGWIRVSDQLVEMHKMVHQMISYQETVNWTDAKPLVQFFTMTLNYNYYQIPKEAWQYAPIAEYLLGQLKRQNNFGFQEDINVLKNNLAAVYKDIGQFNQARQIMEEVVEDTLKNLPEEHPSVAQYMNTLGLLYKNLGDLGKSEELLTKSLHMANKIYEERNFVIMTYKSNLALVYKERGRLKDALNLNESALSDSIILFGENSLQTARCLSTIATVYQDLQDYSKAAYLLEQALRFFEKNLPQSHPDIARNQGNLSLSYQHLGRFNEAISLSRKALKAAEEYYGTEHRTYVTRMKNLGVAYSWAFQLNKSLDTLHESLTLSRRLFGESDSLTRDIKNTIRQLPGGYV